MKPLVKWSGGKRGEIPYLKAHYPTTIARVVEPFAGGAAVAWDLDGVPALLNDVNGDLVRFYRSLQSASARAAVKKALDQINARRRHLRAWVAQLPPEEVVAFFTQPETWVKENRSALAQPALLPSVDTRWEALLTKHGPAKARRIQKIEANRKQVFPVDEQKGHLETALQSALYETLRDVYNRQIKVTSAWHVAAWWAVRVLCFSGMFRFNRQGQLNVPYGGLSYNARDFADSFDGLFGPARVHALSRFAVENLDFAAWFTQHGGFRPDDFVFVDPPYDSAFSQYNVEGDFTAQDQVRLRNTLEACHARWMLVIKRTDYIESLYARRGHHAYVFDKAYTVNFRNRHSRDVQHLVVTNYPLTLSPGDALRPLATLA
jgi:DNA adenine methylase